MLKLRVHMGDLMKTKRIMEGNLFYLFAVLMSQCDSDTKNQVKSINESHNLKIN